ncbi:hypothetical protein BKA64DRAFT_721223 [Cadophora sp. MPI-SDFR-AT-0126]|nr:hypothetical protein BKA64DRAFT_721223 [Leotiomycetes sp. MPI-SDFR-AT-0126]
MNADAYVPCKDTIRSIAEAKDVELDLVDLLYEEVDEELRSHPAFDRMSGPQRNRWHEYHVWCKLFPGGEVIFPGDKTHLDKFERNEKHRRENILDFWRAWKMISSQNIASPSTKADENAALPQSSTAPVSTSSQQNDPPIQQPSQQVSSPKVKEVENRIDVAAKPEVMTEEEERLEEHRKKVYYHFVDPNALSWPQRITAMEAICKIQPLMDGEYVYSLSLKADMETREAWTGQEDSGTISKAENLLGIEFRSKFRLDVHHKIWPWPTEQQALKDPKEAAEKEKDSTRVTTWLTLTGSLDPRVADRVLPGDEATMTNTHGEDMQTTSGDRPKSADDSVDLPSQL